MAALVAECRDHQVGRAVQYLWSVEEVGRGIDEPAEADHPNYLVEVAERGLDLRQEVDGATARGGTALLHGDAGAKLALGDQLAFRVDANLAGHEQQISGAHEADVIGHRACGLMQDHALCRKFLLDRTRHVRPHLIQLGACLDSRFSIPGESDSTLGHEQVFSPLEYRSDAASAAECAGLRSKRPCLAVYRRVGAGEPRSQGDYGQLCERARAAAV